MDIDSAIYSAFCQGISWPLVHFTKFTKVNQIAMVNTAILKEATRLNRSIIFLLSFLEGVEGFEPPSN